jgi:hypothetical protein
MDLCRIVLWGTLTFNRMHLLPGVQDTAILYGTSFRLGPNLRMGWIPGIQLSRQQIQKLRPLSMLPIRLTCIPHVLPMVVFSMNPLAAWRARSSETRRTLSMCDTGISFCMCRHPRGELIGCRTYLETKCGLASLFPCIVVCQVSSQSSRLGWAPMRLSLGITNDPRLWLYVISRAYIVLCVKTLFYFLNFIKSVVIPVLAIPHPRCQGITRNGLKSISYCIKLLADCHIMHPLCMALAYWW